MLNAVMENFGYVITAEVVAFILVVASAWSEIKYDEIINAPVSIIRRRRR